MAGQTLAQKILARAAGTRETDVGQVLDCRVDLAMSHDNAALVSRTFRELGLPRVWDPEKIVIPFDHRWPAPDEDAANAHRAVRLFVNDVGIKNFYDGGVGICHQVLPEKGHVRPGDLIVGTDSHTCTYGAFGAFATGIGATEMAAVWATGKLWLMVPESFRIFCEGHFPSHVMSKDLILRLIGDLGLDGADYRSVEFHGPTFQRMTVASRMTVANMSMEFGAKAGVLLPDQKTFDWLTARTPPPYAPVYPDEDAVYEKEFHYDVDDLEPQVACPPEVDNVKPVSELAPQELRVDQVYFGTCTNGRMEDLRVAADMLRGEKVARGVRMLVTPASAEVFLEARRAGLLETLMDAGALVQNPGCGACLGAHQGILAAGERAITTTSRNYRGRMGSKDAEIYLASPATAAASALYGVIADPRELGRRVSVTV